MGPPRFSADGRGTLRHKNTRPWQSQRAAKPGPGRLGEASLPKAEEFCNCLKQCVLSDWQPRRAEL